MEDNPMRRISIEKLTINVGVGEPGDKLEKSKRLIERLTNTKAVITNAKKKIPGFKIRPGLPIGIKATIRKNAVELLKRLLESVENTIKASSFNGRNLSFGIDEYIHIPGMDYDPSIGVIGLEVTVTLKRPGYSIASRKFKRGVVGKNQLITNDEAINFFKKNFGVKIV